MPKEVSNFNSVMDMKDTEKLVEWGRKHLIHYTRYRPIVLKKGDGITLQDTTGKKYLDFMSGATSINTGYGEERIKESIKEQLKEISTITVSFLSSPVVKLAKLLTEISPAGLSRCFFSCTGSQATARARDANKPAPRSRNLVHPSERGPELCNEKIGL